jgi:hypothetical protein
MAEADWFYARGGGQEGPADLQTLRAMIATGQLLPSDLVWRDGMLDWQPAVEVSALRDAFGGGVAAGAFAGGPASGYPPPPPPGQPGNAPAGPYGQPMAPPYGVPGGQPVVGYYTTTPGRSYLDEARTAMIVSIIGIFCVGIILGPVGIVLGLGAKRNMRASGNLEGDGMATAAVVIGSIVIGLYVLFVFLAVLGVSIV